MDRTEFEAYAEALTRETLGAKELPYAKMIRVSMVMTLTRQAALSLADAREMWRHPESDDPIDVVLEELTGMTVALADSMNAWLKSLSKVAIEREEQRRMEG